MTDGSTTTEVHQRGEADEIFLKGILPSDAQVVVRSYICTYVYIRQEL